MPWGDGTGPAGGSGPGTGRGRGSGSGSGSGRGMGSGMGQGTGRGGKFTGGARSVNQSPQIQQPVSKEQELETLKQQSMEIQQQMNVINKRINELSEEGEKNV